MKAGARFWLLLALCGGQAQAGDFHWPDGRKAAVSLAYDDALDSQLDNALPALDRHGLKASFYLTLAADTLRTRLPALHPYELPELLAVEPADGLPAYLDWVREQTRPAP